MAMSTSSFSYASALRGSAGRDGGSQRPPVLVPPLHHVPALSANAVFIDLRLVKPSVTTEERNDFLLEDLRVTVDEVSEIWPEPESQLLRLVFFTADQYRRYLDRLTAGLQWSACRGALVYGWSPGNAVSGGQRYRPHLHCRRPWFHTARFRLAGRCRWLHRQANAGPLGCLPPPLLQVRNNGCRAGRRVAGADAALWSVIHIPADLFPAAEAAMDTVPARPPSQVAAGLQAVDVAAAFRQRAAATPPSAGPSRSTPDRPPADEEAPVAAAASQLEASNTTHVSSTPSPSTPSLPGGDSATGAVVAAWEVVVPAGGAASTPSPSPPSMPSGDSAAGAAVAAWEVVDPAGGEAPATGAASSAAAAALPVTAAALPATADSDAPAAGSASLSLALQVSGLSDTPSLPPGQGAQLSASLGDSTASLPMLSPISTISSSSSLQSARSRDPRLNRSVSANLRKTESDMESNDFANVAAARTGCKRGLTGGKNGPKKASKKQPKNRSVSPPSQHVSQYASP